MYILSIDTTYYTSASLSIDERIIGYAKDHRRESQCENVAAIVRNVLASCAVKVSDLEAVIVTTGPGSFTGIRVGISCANAIKLANPEVKLLGVSNFDLIRSKCLRQVKNFDHMLIIVHSCRNQCFVESSGKVEALTYEEIPSRVSKLTGQVIVAGDGVLHCYENLTKLDGVTALPRFIRADAKNISLMSSELINKEESDTATPFYYGY